MANETIISFKFKRPGGMALEGKGRFNPQMVTKYKQVPGVTGRFPYVDYDFDEVYQIKLKSETPRPLPSFLKGTDYDEEMRRAFILKQVEAVQNAHEENNKVRDELDYYASTGLIEKVGDTFLDNVIDEAKAIADAALEDAGGSGEVVTRGSKSKSKE